MILKRPGAAQGGSDSLVEGDEVGGVERGVAHAVLVVLHNAEPEDLAESQENVIGKYQEYFHVDSGSGARQTVGRSLR